MNPDDRSLGGRLPLADPRQLVGEKAAFYQEMNAIMSRHEKSGVQVRTADGRLLGPFNAMLESPEIGSAFGKFRAAEVKHTALSGRVREVVILSVGARWRSPYELYAHGETAKALGLSEAAVEALGAGRPSDALTDEELIAQRVTLQLVAERRVDDASYRAAIAAWGSKGLMDLLFLVGSYQFTCSVLNTFEVPLPGESGRTA